jgi:hypothetical protein
MPPWPPLFCAMVTDTMGAIINRNFIVEKRLIAE